MGVNLLNKGITMADFDNPRPSSQPIGSNDQAVAKDNLIVLDHVAVSEENEILNRKGQPRKTLKGLENQNNAQISEAINSTIYSVGFQNVGVWVIGAVVQNSQQTLTYNGEEYNTTAGPFTVTVNGATPVLDSEDWFNVTLEARKTVARSLNVLDSQVIYASDAATLLDSVLYIYDSASQKTWAIPLLDSVGKTIVSVVGDTLTTAGGSGSNTYTLEQIKIELPFDTLQNAIDTKSAVAGYSAKLKERTAGRDGGATWDYVLASSVTVNTYNIVQCAGNPALALVLRGEVAYLEEWGAIHTDNVDNTGAINFALANNKSVTTKLVGKEFTHFDTLQMFNDATTLELGYSSFELDDATGIKNNLEIGEGITQTNGCKVKRCVFTRAQVATAGSAIYCKKVGVTEILDNRIFGNNEIHTGITLFESIIANIEKNYIDNCIHTSLFTIGTDASANRCVDTTVNHNRFEGGISSIITSDFTEGFFCRGNILFNTTGNCVDVDASTNANGLYSFKFESNDFDTTGGHGIKLNRVNNVQIADTWAANNALACVSIAAECDTVTISDGQYYPQTVGVDIFGTNVSVKNALIAGGVDGVVIETGSTNTTVKSNTLQGQSGTHIHLWNNPSDYVVKNNTLSGSAVSPIGGGAAGTNRVIIGNEGDQVAGTGATLAVGASPWSYTTGARPEMLSGLSAGMTAVAHGVQVGVSNLMLKPNTQVTFTFPSTPLITTVYQ